MAYASSEVILFWRTDKWRKFLYEQIQDHWGTSLLSQGRTLLFSSCISYQNFTVMALVQSIRKCSFFYHSFLSVSMLEMADSWSRKIQKDALNRQQNHIFAMPTAGSGCCHSAQVIWTTMETRLCWEIPVFRLLWVLLGNQHSFDYFCVVYLLKFFETLTHFIQIHSNNFLSRVVLAVMWNRKYNLPFYLLV